MSLTLKVSGWLERREWQEQMEALKAATRLAQMVWIAMQLGLMLGRWLLEEELLERAQRQREWPTCRSCGRRLQSKGWQGRQMQTLVGEIA